MFFLENDYLLEEVEPTNMGLDGLEGAYILHAECDEMWYNLREKMMKLEHTAIMTEDADLLLEGKSSFVENVKKLFQKMKQAIEEMFRKFMEWVSRLFTNDKKLVERLKEKGLQSVKINGFKYTGLNDFSTRLMNARQMLDAALTNMAEYNGKKPVTVVAKMLGVSGTVTSDSELVAAVKEKIQGSKERADIEVTRKDAAAILKTAKDDIARAEKVKKSLQAALDSAIKAMQSTGQANIHADEFEKHVSNKKEETIKKASDKASDKLGKRVGIAKDISRTLISGYGAYIAALKDRRSQTRAAAAKLVNGKAEPAKKAKKEDSVQTESFTGILGLF